MSDNTTSFTRLLEQQRIILIVLPVLSYLLLVRLLRFRRRNELLKRSFYKDRAALGRMTIEDAFLIQQSLGELEFPRTFSISVFFALFKVRLHSQICYAISP